MSLERELAAYRRELPRLLAAGEQGRFALVHEDEVVSVWDTRRDALQVGYERFGVVPLLVKLIQEDERPAVITRFLVSNASRHGANDERSSWTSH